MVTETIRAKSASVDIVSPLFYIYFYPKVEPFQFSQLQNAKYVFLV